MKTVIDIWSKVSNAVVNMTKGMTQEALQKVWAKAEKVDAAQEIFGEWLNEKNTPGFMEVIMRFGSDGKGTIFNSARGDGSHDPIIYEVKDSFVCFSREENYQEDDWAKEVEIRMQDGKLLIEDHSNIEVYERSGTKGA